MNVTRMKWAVVALAVLLGGCATSPVSPSSADAVPASRVYDQALTTPAPDTAMITITRDRGMMGAACATELYISGTHVADVRSGEKIVVYVRPGKHVLGARAGGMCGGGADQMQMEAIAGDRTRVRIAAGQAGDLKIEPSAF